MSHPQARCQAARDTLRDEVERAVERVLGARVAPDAILMASGLDSLGSEELLAELSRLGTIQLPGASPWPRALLASCPGARQVH